MAAEFAPISETIATRNSFLGAFAVSFREGSRVANHLDLVGFLLIQKLCFLQKIFFADIL